MDTAAEREKNHIVLTAGRVYLWLMLLGLPLAVWDGYFDITEVKTLWFTAGSLVYLLLRGVLALQYGARRRRPERGELCAMALMLIALFSSALSGRFWVSFTGETGRWQGAGMLWIYAALYAVLADTPFRERDVLLPLAAGLGLSALLAVVHHLGWDVFGLTARLNAFDRGRYISTLGNINFAGAYLTLALPVFLWVLLREEKRGRRALWGGLCLLGLWAAMAVRSECTILGLGAALLLLPFLLRKYPAAMRRWPLLWPTLTAGMQLYRWIAHARGAYLSALTRVLLHPAVSGAMAALGLAAWLLLRRKGKKELRRGEKVYGLVLLSALALAAALLALLNTVWAHVPLGAMEDWLRFSDRWGTDRGRVWAYCLELYRDFPWLDKLLGGGCGVLARLDTIRRIFPDAILDTAHCEYLQILLNWGALGLLAYLGWLGFAAAGIFRRGDGLSLALLSGLTGYAAQAAVNIAQTPGIALFFILLATARREKAPAGIDLRSIGDIIKNTENPTKKEREHMNLTPEQQAILDGQKGEVLSKVMKTLIMYGEAFGAEKLVPVTGEYGHTVISFGINAMKPVYDLYDQILDANIDFKQKFTADPLPLDPNVPSSFLQDVVFKQFMYKQQERYENQLRRMGITGSKDFTCACYFDEVGNIPRKGDVLSWAESSAVSYANSVLGARCNRNSGMIDIMGSAVGYVPFFGLLTDEGRKAAWVVEVKTKERPEAQLLGSAIGMKVMEDVPFIRGLDRFFPAGLDGDAKAYLKDFGAAAASNGAVGLYHVENLTPEAVEQGESLIADGAQVYVVDDAELERVKASYPVIWKKPDAKPKLCFIGCPHLTMDQLIDWTRKVEAGLQENGLDKVAVPTVFTTAPAVLEEFNKGPYGYRLKKTGVVLSYICPLMYMNNPLSKKMPVITCSNKLRTYTSARYYTEGEILGIITGKEAK